MKTIYELMNDVWTDVEDYTEEKLSDLERKRWEKKIKKQIHTHKRRRYAMGAAGILICMTALCAGPFREEIYAAMSSAGEALQAWIMVGDNADITPYETVVNTTEKDDGIEVTLESAFVDANELVISTLQSIGREKANAGYWGVGFSGNQSFDEIRKDMQEKIISGEYDKEEEPILAAELYINNEKVKANYDIINMDKQEDGRLRVLYVFSKEGEKLDLNQQLEIKLKLEEVTGVSKGKWQFAFSAEGEELAASSVSVPQNIVVPLPEGKEITVNEYRHSEIHTSIEYEGDIGKGYAYQLRGKNDRGETVWFHLNSFEKNGRFEVDAWNVMRTKDIQSITLTLYCGKISEKPDKSWNPVNYEPYGDPFTIQVQ